VRDIRPGQARRRQPRPATARERIDHAAYDLFSRHGIRGTGVDAVSARAGVTKMTLYRYYPSKNHLVLAFLHRREELWSRAWLQRQVEDRAVDPRERLLAIFDVFDKWFRRTDYEGCSFINTVLEYGGDAHPIRAATIKHIANVREFLRALASQAGIRDAEGFAQQWQILMRGSIVAACEGDRAAALRAKKIGRLLLSAATSRRTQGIASNALGDG
jgi:AcrR family transcriptional regulator